MHDGRIDGTGDCSRAIEMQPDALILEAIADGQAAAVAVVRQAIPAIARAAAMLVSAWRAGGRIAYAGAGSSGLIGMLDAVELPCTFGMPMDRLPLLLAGLTPSHEALDNSAEDDLEAGSALVRRFGLADPDVLIALSASGTTPFTLAAAATARDCGAKIVSICCKGSAPLLDLADASIALVTGSEVVADSTRMNAGTAEKCAVNMLSTLTAMRLHHVYDGMMVNMHAENVKLRKRAVAIVARAAGVAEAAALSALKITGEAVKPAILVAAGASPELAQQVLLGADGDIRAALAGFRSSYLSGDIEP
jgi:N-acetylmuramic acid 6-phosphate etherase